MFNEIKSPVPWDLADKKTHRVRFSPASFYIVVDGIQSESVRVTCAAIKEFLLRVEGVSVRGPKPLKTERRRWMRMRQMAVSETETGAYVTNHLRYRSVLLVIEPTSAVIASLISLDLASDVNIKIEPYNNQFDLREDK